MTAALPSPLAPAGATVAGGRRRAWGVDRGGGAGARRRGVALAALVVTSVGWLATLGRVHGGARWVPVLVVVALHAWLVAAERRRPSLSRRAVLAAVAVVAVLAVATPHFGSRDLYQYAAYGRMVTHHHVSPHLVAPEAVPGGDLFDQLAPGWHGSPSVYGPAFTAWSALGSYAYGDSPALAVAFFRGSAAAALLGASLVLHRRRCPTATLLAVGLSPVLVLAVQGGHNDVIAGALALAGLDLHERHRPVAGALVVAVACSVKLLVAPVALALVVGALVRGRRTDAVRTAALVGGVLVAGYLAVGGPAALAPLRSVGAHTSRATSWAVVEALPGWAATFGTSGLGADVALLAAAVVVVAGAVVLRAAHPGTTPASLATSLGVVASFGAAYALPWYPAALLPVAALGAGAVAGRALALGATALVLAYVQPPGAPAGDLVLAPVAAQAAGVVLGVAVVVTVVGAACEGRRARARSLVAGAASAPSAR
ncbi:MAG TPA: glycosyltransferase 87 family protein [Aquihabitans sp.]|nr:glycosyltransferase 87 family protein [Aquihabitans sp.]